jgi:hypothetical protein
MYTRMYMCIYLYFNAYISRDGGQSGDVYMLEIDIYIYICVYGSLEVTDTNIYIFICIYIYIFIYIFIHICMHTCIYISIYMHVYAYLFVYPYVY